MTSLSPNRLLLSLSVVCTGLACGPSTKFEGNNVRQQRQAHAKASEGVREENATQAAAEEVLTQNAVPDDPSPAGQPPVQNERPAPPPPLPMGAELKFTGAGDDGALTVSFANGYLEGSLQLAYLLTTEAGSKSIVQTDREMVTRSFKQGGLGREVIESFSGSGFGIVDIILVIDNSGSMAPIQEKLAERLPDLVSEVSGSDWQIRIATTNPDQSCPARALIKKSDADANALFRSAAKVGVTGGGDWERGVQSAILGLQCNDNWVRPHSTVAVLIVSDEDNCEDGNCEEEDIPNNQPATLKSVLAGPLGGTTRVVGEDARVFGLFKLLGDTCTNGKKGLEYVKLVNETKGVYGSVCAPDYIATFKKISEGIREQLQANFNLANVPSPGSVVVQVDGVLKKAGIDYEVVGDTLRFINKPASAANIKVTYRLEGSPVLKSFALGSEVGRIESIVVTGSDGVGRKVDSSLYLIEGSELVFKVAPEDGAEIRATFRKKEPALGRSFDVAKGALPASVKVSVNGKAAAASYDAASGKIEFAEAPSDGAEIKVDYSMQRQTTPNLRYAMGNIDTQRIRDLSAVDESTREPVPIQIKEGAFEIAAQHFAAGRKLKLRYRLLQGEQHDTYPLPKKTSSIKDIVVSLYDDAGAKILCEQVHIDDGNQLSVDCEFKNLVKTEVSYPRVPAKAQRLKLDDPNAATSLWTVLVNSKATTAYERQGNELVFTERLPPFAQITVLLEPRKN